MKMKGIKSLKISLEKKIKVMKNQKMTEEKMKKKYKNKNKIKTKKKKKKKKRNWPLNVMKTKIVN